jgi:ketosteroid isomerase-like protein
MVPDQRCATVRAAYADVADDLDRLWELCDDDVVFHIAGTHPLSGSYFGRAAVQTYVDALRGIPGDGPGFMVTSVLADPRKHLLLVEGTATTGCPAFVRTLVHVLRFREGRLTEFWDYPFDQDAENAFWRAYAPQRVPAQRRALQSVPTPPLG